ncbi:MAG: hypothetical protein GY903_15965 [Fuerstiella sp.]|nr:hypothetical protein [Fuerstiella sp.]MCP4855979.1 hypothetical protein [Fuerstiella sp.]
MSIIRRNAEEESVSTQLAPRERWWSVSALLSVAIVMFETGPCACRQDHNRLRRRLVEEHDID